MEMEEDPFLEEQVVELTINPELEQKLASRTLPEVFMSFLYKHGGEHMEHVMLSIGSNHELTDLITCLTMVKGYLNQVQTLIEEDSAVYKDPLDFACVAVKAHESVSNKKRTLLNLEPTPLLVHSWKESSFQLIRPHHPFDVPEIHIKDNDLNYTISSLSTKTLISGLVSSIVHTKNNFVGSISKSKLEHVHSPILEALKSHSVPVTISSHDLAEIADNSVLLFYQQNSTLLSNDIANPRPNLNLHSIMEDHSVMFKDLFRKYEGYNSEFQTMLKNPVDWTFSKFDLEESRAFRGHPLLRNFGKDTGGCLSMFFPGVNTISKWVDPLAYVLPFLSQGFALGHSTRNNWSELMLNYGFSLSSADLAEFEVPTGTKIKIEPRLTPPYPRSKNTQDLFFEDNDLHYVNIFKQALSSRSVKKVDGLYPVVFSDVYFSGPIEGGKGKIRTEATLAEMIKILENVKTMVSKGTIVALKMNPSEIIPGLSKEGRFDWIKYFPYFSGFYLKVFPGGRMHNGEIIVVLCKDNLPGMTIYDDTLPSRIDRLIKRRMHFANNFRNFLLILGIPCLMRATARDLFALRYLTDQTVGFSKNVETVPHMQNVSDLAEVSSSDLWVDIPIDPGSWADQEELHSSHRIQFIPCPASFPATLPINVEKKPDLRNSKIHSQTPGNKHRGRQVSESKGLGIRNDRKRGNNKPKIPVPYVPKGT